MSSLLEGIKLLEKKDRKMKKDFAEYADLVDKPIEPGLVLVMLELQRLSKEDVNKYVLLHDWLVEKLGEGYYQLHIASGYAQDDVNEISEHEGFYKVREEYLEALAKPNEKIYC
jgi:hypothetical protein